MGLTRPQRSIDALPIPPTVPATEFESVGMSAMSTRGGGRGGRGGSGSGRGAAAFVSPEYSGSFFDNVAVRSHSYTSLSKLAKLSELQEQPSASPKKGQGTPAQTKTAT